MNRSDIATKVRSIAAVVLRENGFVSPVEVLLRMGWLTKADHEGWRFQRIAHLEKVMRGNLSQHEFLLRELRAFAREQQLKPSRTAYVSWGKHPRRPLRFTRFGHPRLEEFYSTHYVGKKSSAEILEIV